jgi:RNA polymerase sigma-70 factor (ECF subfamily)
MTTDLAERPTSLQPAALDVYRSELTKYCSRLLGSSFEADDAVQETMLRAWRNLDRFEGRSSVKTWLYSIAINVCHDMLRTRNRLPAPTALGTATDAPTRLGGRPSSLGNWSTLTSVSNATAAADPVDEAITNESVHAAFAAALHCLPPRQRAVLVLREVLRWPASETAELLDVSVASVNSALQRARATLAGGCAARDSDGGDRDSRVVDRCATALKRTDVDTLISQLIADATKEGPKREPGWSTVDHRGSRFGPELV